MLKIPFKKDITLKKNIFLSSEDGSSDRDFVFSKTINVESLAKINDIVDFENVEYKPTSNKIEMDLFFLRYLKTDEFGEVYPYIEDSFKDYHTSLKKNLILPKKSELFQTQNTEGVALPKYDNETSLSPEQIMVNKPYVVIDPLVENRKKYPKKEGYPHFYNTFTFPFWENADVWKDLKYGFNNKAYTYNSFIIIEIYDDYNPEKQNRVMSIPVYVSDRYMFKEKTAGKTYNVLDELGNVIQTTTEPGVEQKRPVFNLMEGVDGYSLFFLKKYIKNTFYAKFYFWDALNGKKIQFIPSSKSNLRKKWLQDVETFDQKDLYLKYEINYDDRSYEIFDYNKSTNEYEILCNDHIDLYEFAYDDYWASTSILNTQPTDIKLPTNPRLYGDLLLSRPSINKNLIYDTTYPLVTDALAKLPDYEEVKITKSYGPVYVCLEYNEYGGCNQYDLVNYYDVTGSLPGYAVYIGNDLNVKNLSLLVTSNNKIVNDFIISQKINIGGIIVENKNNFETYVTTNIKFENVKLETEANKIIIDSSGYLDHTIYNEETKSTELYTEYGFIPRKLGSTITNYDTTKGYFEAHFEYFKQNNSTDSFSSDRMYDQQLEDFVNNIDNQLILATGLINGGKVNLISSNRKYSNEEISNKLKNDPNSKKDMFIITASVLDTQVKANEQVIVQINFYIGKELAKTFNQIKTLSFSGDLNVTFKNSANDNEEIIKIPVNFNLK